MDTETLYNLQVHKLRFWIRDRARVLCGGADSMKGIGKLAPLYVATTEGRDPKSNWANWSSCGELVQCLAQELGIAEPWLNRAPHWRTGDNLTSFYDPKRFPTAPAKTPASDYEPDVGDFGFIWTPEGKRVHTFVFGERVDDSHIETFNYGAGGMSPAEFPGAKEAHQVCVRARNGLWSVGDRGQYLQRVATVPALLNLANAERISELLS